MNVKGAGVAAAAAAAALAGSPPVLVVAPGVGAGAAAAGFAEGVLLGGVSPRPGAPGSMAIPNTLAPSAGPALVSLGFPLVAPGAVSIAHLLGRRLAAPRFYSLHEEVSHLFTTSRLTDLLPPYNPPSSYYRLGAPCKSYDEPRFT